MAYEALFQQVASAKGLNWWMLAAQGWRESRHNPSAVGRAGDMGIMQILPATWNEWASRVNVRDPFDPQSNILLAASYLVWISEQLAKVNRGEPYWMLVAYNWGIGNVLRTIRAGGGWDQVPPERQEYATAILLTAEANALAAQIRRSGLPIYE